MKKIFSLLAAVLMMGSMSVNADDIYLKHNWGGTGWTWKQTTYDEATESYLLRELFGATGCNWNTSASDNGSSWVGNPTTVGNPAVGDSAIFAYKNGEITITKIGEPNAEATTRFLKHDWGGTGNWVWKEMTREGETTTYTLRDIYGGTGCNWNTVGNDAGATWVAEPTLVGAPAVGDSAVFTLVEGAITITKMAGAGPAPEPVYDTLYLVNSKGWGSPKLHLWGGVASGTSWPGVDMVKVNGVQADGFDVYMYSYKHGDYTSCIFNNGSSVQSADLTIGDNVGKFFNFADQTWYETAEAVVCTWYINANFNGTTEWRELTRGEGVFTRRDVFAPAANYYYNGMAQNNLQSEIKGSKLTVDANLTAGDWALYTLDPYAKTLSIVKLTATADTAMFVAGNFTDWANGMQTLPYAITLPADSALEFKQVMRVITSIDAVPVDTALTWFGQMNEATMTRENIGEGWLLDGENNVLLTTDAAGEYIFSLNENGTFMVTFPYIPTALDTIEAGKATKVLVNGMLLIERGNNRYTVTGIRLN